MLVLRREDEDMKMKTYVWGAFLGLVLVIMPAARVQAFDDLERMCRDQASAAMNVSRSDVDVRRGENMHDGSGNRILLWEARLHDGTRSRGYCQVDPRRQQIVRFESREYSGQSGDFISQEDAERACHAEAVRRLGMGFRDVGTDALRPTEDGNYRVKWYTDVPNGNNSGGVCEVDRRGSLVHFDQARGDRGDGGDGRASPVGEYPRVKVDTGGTGSFDGGRFRDIRLERVSLDTRDRPVLVLVGRHEFRIAFYGEVINSDGNRELTLRVNASDHGDVHGRAQIRLNPDRNEIETMDFHGTMDGGELNSSFVRGH
jgi:hypothetical protein